MTNEQEPIEPSADQSAVPMSASGMGPMGCQPSLEEFYKYMDGALDEERQAMIATHLHRCGGCDDFYHFQTGIRQLLGTCCQSELPADLPKRVFRAITDLT